MDTGPALAYLHVIASDESKHAVAINQSPFCIGRAEHNDLVLAEEQISRHHACLRIEGGRIQLVDMGSENGTWIDATRLEPNRPYMLDYHETFRIGSYQILLEPSPGAPLPQRPEEETVPLSSATPEPAEIHAKASAQPRIEPLIESSPGGRLGVLLKTLQINVTPGISTNISLVVINQGQTSDGFRITLY